MADNFLWTRIIPLVGLLAYQMGPALAGSGQATDAAFGALLSMPGAQPRDGGWVIPEEYAVAPSDESELIARLRDLKREGANFNAIRHQGTLLAHSIRAGKDRTAAWLLSNGANPKRVLSNGSTTAYDLALRYKRSVVVKQLESIYGFTPPKLSQSLSRPTAVAPAVAASPSSSSSRERATALLSNLRGPYPSEADRREWRIISATLRREEFAEIFKDGTHLPDLIRLVRDVEGGLEEALSRLPVDVVRRGAQDIADLLGEWSYATYSDGPKIRYTTASRSWPALWSRIKQPLRYETSPRFAERIPPALWPVLFASGYAEQDAEATGCLLSAVAP